MSNLTIFEGNFPADAGAVLNQITTELKASAGGSGVPWLMFNGKSGRYTFEGADAENREAVIAWTACEKGWRGWADKTPEDVLVPITDTGWPQQPDDLRDSSGKLEPFKKAVRVVGQFADGANEQFEMTLATWAGVKAFEQLMDACRVQHASGSTYLFPVVSLEQGPSGDDYGNYKPIFRVLRWMNSAGEVETVASADEAEPRSRKRR